MIGFFEGLGAAAPKVKQIAPPKVAKPDPKVQQAKNQVEATIRQVEALLADVPTNTEYRAYLECLRRRLNDISIVCNEPSTPIAKVRQMAREAATQAKKDAALVKKEEKRAVVEQKQAEKKATVAAKAEARKQKKLANGKIISIEPKEEAAISALESQIAQTTAQIADTKKKIADAKAKRARGMRGLGDLGRSAKPRRRLGAFGMGGLGFLGDTIGGINIDCTKKKNAVICAVAQLTQQTQDQMAGLIQQLMDKQVELEALLAELSALVASTPTADDIVAGVVAQTPPGASAQDIADAVSTSVADAVAALTPPVDPYQYQQQPFYDPTYGQQPQYIPVNAGQNQPTFYDPNTGQILQGPGAQTIATQPQILDAGGDVFGGGWGAGFDPNATLNPSLVQQQIPQAVQSDVLEDTGAGMFNDAPNIDDLLNDFGEETFEDGSGMFGLGCGENKKCGCKN